MSQEKVDQHKAEKKNRKKLNKKARIQRIAGYACAVLVVVLVAVWVGFSVYSKVTGPSEAELASDSSDINIDELMKYLQEGDSAATDATTEADTATDNAGAAEADTAADSEASE